jgi:hypothetical protein
MLLAPKEAEMSTLSNFNIYAFWRCKISGKTHEIFDAKNEWGVFTTFVTPPACVDRPPRLLARATILISLSPDRAREPVMPWTF